ncbi:ABC transporter ATP-binding protein [Cereibacter sp. SYSU M97828]|nr:ABC transporter ATP-binding protein [Cereibacter flavus]
MSNRGTLDIRNVAKTYEVEGRQVNALSGVNLHVAPGEFISIVGPSGCGKSTLLRLIIGLDTGYQGDILLDGHRITGTSLDRGIVFQDHRLLPWLTLEQNVALALENSRLSGAERKSTVTDHIELVGLSGFESAWPHQLSGGMAQRAAIARGLVGRPGILLLDEPLGALDALTRLRLQEELVRIWKAEGVTMILVTHDVDEAIYLSDRVVVMNSTPGRIVDEIAVDLPRPRDRAGAEFSAIKRRVLSLMGEYAEAA